MISRYAADHVTPYSRGTLVLHSDHEQMLAAAVREETKRCAALCRAVRDAQKRAGVPCGAELAEECALHIEAILNEPLKPDIPLEERPWDPDLCFRLVEAGQPLKNAGEGENG